MNQDNVNTDELDDLVHSFQSYLDQINELTGPAREAALLVTPFSPSATNMAKNHG